MVKLGDKVKDTVSGFEGVAVSRHIYLHGCERISVQPPVDKKGACPEAQTFDEPQLKVLTKKVVKIGNRNVGGCDKYMDEGR